MVIVSWIGMHIDIMHFEKFCVAISLSMLVPNSRDQQGTTKLWLLKKPGKTTWLTTLQ